MKSIIIVAAIVLFAQVGMAQNVSASHMWTNESDGSVMSIDALVDTEAEEVTLTLSGPENQWFAYGFGSTVMMGTYAIVLERVDGISVITERRLQRMSSGDVLTQRYELLSEVVDDGIRTVQLKVPMTGGSEYYDFPTETTNVPIISAVGYLGNLGYHGSENKMQGAAGGMNDLEFSYVVPVSWSRFSLSNEGYNVLLEWETESELDNEGFFVERSLDGEKWKDLDFIEGKGGRGGLYKYTDQESLPGVNYYRLKQVDVDGTASYSVVKSIEVQGGKDAGDIVLFPNPVVDQLRIQQLVPRGVKRVQIIDMRYQLVAETFLDDGAEEGSVDVSSLASGHYLIMIKSREWSFVSHFVKQ